MTESDLGEQAKQSSSPGAALAGARKARQLSLHAVARELKLSRTTLEHIEADRFERIAPIYRRGYIANYARLVGIDPQSLLVDVGSTEPEPLRTVLPAAGKPQRFDRFLKFATYALVTTMIVPPLVYFFVLGGARLFESEMVAGDHAGRDAVSSQAHKPGYRERLAGALAVQPLEDMRQDESHLSASALPMASIRSLSQEDSARDDRVSEQPGTAESEQDSSSELEVVLSDDSWVEIESADGVRLEFDLLRGGEARQYSGIAPFKLLLGRGSAVELRLDGERVAFAGQQQGGVTELVVGQDDTVEAPETASSREQPAD
ncbi:MAG: DUF4115 domain-containing protein [Wenzhouxiangellaceae bacterium]